jgi:hypothetical protein
MADPGELEEKEQNIKEAKLSRVKTLPAFYALN